MKIRLRHPASVMVGGARIGVITDWSPSSKLIPEIQQLVRTIGDRQEGRQLAYGGSMKYAMGGVYTYNSHGVMPIVDPAVALDELMAIDWEQRDAPRKEYYCNDIAAPYAYGNGAGRRTYHPRPWPDVVKRIQAYLEGMLTTRLEVCFLNRYDTNRDHLGWHADDSPEMDNARPIVVVSFGSERVIQVRRIAEPTVVESLDLGPGSVFVMHPGMQQTHQHRIPKAGKVVGPRISLTFRGYLSGGDAHREGS